MKKWLKFFFLSFFSNEISKDGARRGYTNFFLGLVLAFIFLWAGFVGGDMLPFGLHYKNSPDFVATAHSVFANADPEKGLIAKIEDGHLRVRSHDGEYTEDIFVNTYENDAHRQNYSVNGYDVVVDSRPADTLAEVEAYYLSNDGKNLKISCEEYLTLSEVARLNFDFKLSYTGRELKLNDEMIQSFKLYLDGLSDEIRAKVQSLDADLGEGKITKDKYDRAIYELYFTNYYPAITSYESSSKVPLLRNYYYHNYIKTGGGKYLFVFDDYLAGSFETKGGIKISFYGFFSDLEDGVLVEEGSSNLQAQASVDAFIKKSFNQIAVLNLYAYAMNVMSLMPFMALMPMVATLLIYSILRLRGVESMNSLGSTFKIIGSYVWFSGTVAALFTVIIAFFVQKSALSALPLVAFFVTLLIRSTIFAIGESKSYFKRLEELEQSQQLEEQETNQTEV